MELYEENVVSEVAREIHIRIDDNIDSQWKMFSGHSRPLALTISSRETRREIFFS